MTRELAIGTTAAVGVLGLFYLNRFRRGSISKRSLAGPGPYSPRVRLGSKEGRTVVVITGVCGNLGRKLARYLVETYGAAVEVRGVEHPLFCRDPPPGVALYVGDASKPGGWQRAMDRAGAGVHFSAVNPYPNADWAESAASMAHAFNVVLYAASRKVSRVVVASSNHVMGGYKDDAAHGTVFAHDPPRVGTALNDPVARSQSGDAVAYGAAKLAAEELLRSLAPTHPKTAFIALRIGWCQPGANSPTTISASGCPPEYQAEDHRDAAIAGEAVDDAWFRGMWLSNADFTRAFAAAIFHKPIKAGFHLANAMSSSRGGRWDLDATEALLGFRPADDAYKAASS